MFVHHMSTLLLDQRLHAALYNACVYNSNMASLPCFCVSPPFLPVLSVALLAVWCIAGTGFLPVWTAQPLLKAVCFDANVKANRYRSAGRSGGYDGVERTHQHFLGAAHAELWELVASGELPPTSSRQRNTAAGDDVDLELDGQCHPHLSCARETSLVSGISDECGLVGGVCSHGQPLVGGFAAMPAPERLLYYDLILKHKLLEAGVDIMFLDTGCTYARHWQLHMPEDAPKPVHIRVPWWHARGHGSSCYLRNSGLYLSGLLGGGRGCRGQDTGRVEWHS